jgi:hypothetical protein
MFGISAGMRYHIINLRLRPLRALVACTATAAVMILAGSGGTQVVGGRHMQPLSQRLLAELKTKRMEKDSPILVRIFKG